MKKVSLDKTMHIASTSKCGKGNNKRYAFQDFSNLIELRDNMRQSEKRKPKKKTHKRRKNNFTAIHCNQTHIFVPREESAQYPGFVQVGSKLYSVDRAHQFGAWIVLPRLVSPNDVLGMYPNAIEVAYSHDGDVFPNEKFTFANVK